MKIEEITMSGDCYEIANLLNNQRPGDRWYNDPDLATLAAQEMQAAGWHFLTYNEFGQEVWGPNEKTNI